jgi:hypothetical protein
MEYPERLPRCFIYKVRNEDNIRFEIIAVIVMNVCHRWYSVYALYVRWSLTQLIFDPKKMHFLRNVGFHRTTRRYVPEGATLIQIVLEIKNLQRDPSADCERDYR